MKVMLCGYHEAGYRALRMLIARRHEVLVATHETPPGIPSVEALADLLGIPCVSGSMEDAFVAARDFEPELILSVYYRQILPNHLLELASQGAFNFHPSLLPRHRGCFSAPWAIISGDTQTGVSCHRMVSRVDAGEIIDVNTVPIHGDDTGMSLYYKLVDATLDLFERVVARAQEAPLTGQQQVEEGSYHDRSVPNGGVIDLSWPRPMIDRFVRALDFPPYPPAVVTIGGHCVPVRSMDEYDDHLAKCVQRQPCP